MDKEIASNRCLKNRKIYGFIDHFYLRKLSNVVPQYHITFFSFNNFHSIFFCRNFGMQPDEIHI